MERLGRHAPTMKAVFALGFGAALIVWLFAGYYFTQRMAAVQRESGAVNLRYMEAQEILSRVRTDVLLGSVAVRDALLDPSADSVNVSRELVVSTYGRVDEALERYVPILDPAGERARVDWLRRNVAGFRSALLEVLATDPTEWRTHAPMLLNRIMPRRASVMQLSDDIQKLNRGAFVQQQRAQANVAAVTHRRIWQILSFALAGSLGIGLAATLYVGRLERGLQRQRVKALQTTTDLQRLSTKLVTAQEEERRAIARELHDELGQVLMAIKVEITLAQRHLDPAGARLLDDAQFIANGAITTVRDLSHLLHPAMLDDLGLVAALDWYLSLFGVRHGVAVEFVHEGMAGRLPMDIETTVYRIVQEAMTNVVKHARARTAFVYLERVSDALRLTVEDDGLGFDPKLAKRGLGIIGIRERVAHFQGRTQLRTRIDGGTRLVIELPVRTSRRAATTPDPGADATKTGDNPGVLLG